MNKRINIVDLFAGPGGLGEGFSSFTSLENISPFHIRISVEKEPSAHATLTLRAFFRILKRTKNLSSYFDYTDGKISKNQLIELHPLEWNEALSETLHQPSALGIDNEKIHNRLVELKNLYKNEPWIVIGGPPCQAYSLVGRARNKGIKDYSPETDHRHFLYKEYLQVLSIIEPDVFVMENVKGILSSKINDELIFPRILNDLQSPNLATGCGTSNRKYQIYSFVKTPDRLGLANEYSDLADFVIKSEDYGIPQTRHRVILLGIATDINVTPTILIPQPKIPIEDILDGLPALRSKLSKEKDSFLNWSSVIKNQSALIVNELAQHKHLKDLHKSLLKLTKDKFKIELPTQNKFYTDESISHRLPKELRAWIKTDTPNKRVLNHESRGHMNSDLGRYLFSSSWAEVFGNTNKPFPKSADFPSSLKPAHLNWESGKFSDRFRVQRKGRPATTITSHISKDGHYFIHPDPSQCRSLTVREAARIQTFPDNYFFEGTRTQQYVQVGNAVPPYLATQLAEIVWKLVSK
jgi:DNA (cytosine-5)-methyltransferase 1